MQCKPFAKLGQSNEAVMESHVNRNHAFSQRWSTAEVEHGSEGTSCPQPAQHHKIGTRQCCSAQGDARQPRYADVRGDCDFNWIAGWEIEPMKPGCGPTAEGRPRRKTALNRREMQLGIIS
jgi:hypothetical protein